MYFAEVHGYIDDWLIIDNFDFLCVKVSVPFQLVQTCFSLFPFFLDAITLRVIEI